MTEFLTVVRDWGGALAFLGGIAVLLISTRFPTKAELALANGKIERLEDRVSKIEGEMQHLPDREVTHRLEISMTEIRGEMAAMNEKLRPVAATMTRMQDFLMEQK